jgi:hypothetical protein
MGESHWHTDAAAIEDLRGHVDSMEPEEFADSA